MDILFLKILSWAIPFTHSPWIFCSCRRDHISWGKLLLEFFAKLPRFMGLSCAEKKHHPGLTRPQSCLCLPTFNFKVKDIGRVSISSTTTPEGARTLTEARQKGNGRTGGGKKPFFGGAKPSEVEVNWGYNYLFMTDISWYIDFLEWFSTISRMIFHHFSDI